MYEASRCTNRVHSGGESERRGCVFSVRQAICAHSLFHEGSCEKYVQGTCEKYVQVGARGCTPNSMSKDGWKPTEEELPFDARGQLGRGRASELSVA